MILAERRDCRLRGEERHGKANTDQEKVVTKKIGAACGNRMAQLCCANLRGPTESLDSAVPRTK